MGHILGKPGWWGHPSEDQKLSRRRIGKSSRFYSSSQGLEAGGQLWWFVPVCELFHTQTYLSTFMGPDQKELFLEFCALWTLELLLEYQLFLDWSLSRPENEQLIFVWRQILKTEYKCYSQCTDEILTILSSPLLLFWFKLPLAVGLPLAARGAF